MAEQWFVEQADGTIDGPFHERQISTELLSGSIAPNLRIRQGNTGPWCAASRARDVFQQLADQGWYVRATNEIFGPFTPEKLLLLSKSGDLDQAAEIRKGTDGVWKRAETVLSLWQTQAAPKHPNADDAQDINADATAQSKWSTEPIRHHHLALESIFEPVLKECQENERLLLAGADSGHGVLSVTRCNGQTLGYLSPNNSHQLLSNQERGISHIVLFSKHAAVTEVAIILCPPGTTAGACRAYVETHFHRAQASDFKTNIAPNIKS